MAIWSVILNVIILLLLPFLAGVTLCHYIPVKKTLASCYFLGSILEWAIIQIIAVPLILLKCSFLYVVVLVAVSMLLISGYGFNLLLKKNRRSNIKRKPLSYSDWFSIAILFVGFVLLMYSIATKTFKDYDDSRFVVSAVDIVRTNRMLLTNPSTGLAIDGLYGDFVRDAVSPWMVYIAYIAKVTNTHAAIVAHTMLRYSLTLCMISVYWLIADTFFGESVFSKSGFVLIAILVNVFGIYSFYNAEAFAMVRIWQGKAVVASIGIPLVFILFSWIYNNPEDWKYYMLLYIAAFALCLMSGMGIIICGLASVSIGLIYSLQKKNISIMIKTIPAVLIPAGYYLTSHFLLNYSL